jgi:hypothetical protein
MTADFEDVTYRARQALHYLDHNPDEREGWMPYFGGCIVGGPPSYGHSEWDACDVGWRMVEAYLGTRRVLGEREPGHAEQRLRTFVLGTLRADGLSYRPERAWSRPHAWMWDHGRALLALSTWMRLEPSDEVAEAARRMVQGLTRIARREADGQRAFFPAENWTGSNWGDTVYGHPPTGLAIEGMVDLAALLDDEDMLAAAAPFVQWVRQAQPPFFAEDGSVVRKGGGPLAYVFTHLHARISIANGLLKYALATRDQGLFEWARSVYVQVRDGLSSSFGFVPESLESGPDLGAKGRCECCAVCDMMQTAAILAEHGYATERETLVRYGVNQLFGHQILDFAPLRHLMLPPLEQPDQPGISYRDLPDRFLGCFTGCTHVNDVVVDVTRPFDGPAQLVDASGCCSQSGAKGLYVLWSQAARRQGEAVIIDGWVTLDNADVRVRCGEPTTGSLQVTAKRACADLVICAPAYLNRDQVKVSPVRDPRTPPLRHGQPLAGNLGGDPTSTAAEHAWHCGPQQAGDTVTLTYPLPERQTEETICGVPYRVHWRGGRVMQVRPEGEHCSHYWWRQH